MIRVTVEYRGKRLAYDTDLPVEVGSAVELPMFWWMTGSGWVPPVGRVVALGSDYAGDCRRIVRLAGTAP